MTAPAAPGTATSASGAGAAPGGRVQVMLWVTEPSDDAGAVERAYHEISSKLVGTPGLLGNRLLRSAADPSRFVVVSEWTSMAEFGAWESGADHRPTTSPLRPLQDPAMRATIYTEIAAYGPEGAFTGTDDTDTGL